MKMSAIERLAIAEAAHSAQRAYRQVLDDAHEEIAAALDKMPVDDSFTPSELAAAAGVPYQALYTLHTGAETGLTRKRDAVRKRYAALLPDGTADLAQVITVTRNTVRYIRTEEKITPRTTHGLRYQQLAKLNGIDPTDILSALEKNQLLR